MLVQIECLANRNLRKLLLFKLARCHCNLDLIYYLRKAFLFRIISFQCIQSQHYLLQVTSHLNHCLFKILETLVLFKKLLNFLNTLLWKLSVQNLSYFSQHSRSLGLSWESLSIVTNTHKLFEVGDYLTFSFKFFQKILLIGIKVMENKVLTVYDWSHWTLFQRHFQLVLVQNEDLLQLNFLWMQFT